MTQQAGSASTGGFSERSKWIAASILMLVLVAILVGLAEVALRVRHHLKYGAPHNLETLYRTDPELKLRVLVPGVSIGNIRVNTLGFRGDEIPKDKPAGTIRVAFIGASTVFCSEVSGNDKVWAHIATDLLRQKFPEVKFDYVNGSAPGYTLSAQLLNLQKRVAPLKPDVIVFEPGVNDMTGDVRDIAQKQGIRDKGSVDGDSWLSKHSMLWSIAEKNLKILFAQRRTAAGDQRIRLDAAAIGIAFEAGTRELIAEARKIAPVVAVVPFSPRLRPGQTTEEQSASAAAATFYMPYMSPADFIAGYERFNGILRKAAQDSGALLIGGEYDVPGDATHFVDSHHFSDAGSRRQAERIVKALTESPAIGQLVAAAKR